MPDAALCAQVAALRASLDALTNVTIAPGVAAELSADLGAVKANLAQFTAAARGHAQAQTDALQSTLTKLATAIRDLAASPSTDTASAVRAALGEVKAAGQELVAAVARECPSASPTPSR